MNSKKIKISMLLILIITFSSLPSLTSLARNTKQAHTYEGSLFATILHPKTRTLQKKQEPPPQSLILFNDVNMHSTPKTEPHPQMFAQVALEKILMHYSQKMEISTQAHSVTTQFVFESILYENALQMGIKEPLSLEKLYSLLKDRVETVKDNSGQFANTAVINVNMEYSDRTINDIQKLERVKNSPISFHPNKFIKISLQFFQSKEKTSDSITWNIRQLNNDPHVQFIFGRTPDTKTLLPDKLETFYATIKSTLDQKHRNLAFQKIIKNILTEKQKNNSPQKLTQKDIETALQGIFKDHTITLEKPFNFCTENETPCLKDIIKSPDKLTQTLLRTI